MTNKARDSRFHRLLCSMFFVSFGASFFFFDIGFALKPYMITTLITAIYLLYKLFRKELQIHRPVFYEYILILFLSIVGFSALYSVYPDSSIRFTFNVAIILFTYFTLRTFFLNFMSLQSIRSCVAISGAIISVASLLFYGLGAYDLGFNFSGNNISSFGMTIDRGVPRLMGIVTQDPNLTAAYLSVFLFFILFDKRYMIVKVVLFLNIFLTFSRGAFLAIVIALCVFLIMNMGGLLKIIKKAVLPICLIIVAIGILSATMGINVVDLVSGRIISATDDGGSGRVYLWSNAIKTFESAPIVGIGANSSLDYNVEHYGDYHYVHNTYLEILSELGIIGVFVYVFLIFLVLHAAVSCRRGGDNTPPILFIVLLIQMGFLSMMTNESFVLVILMLTASIKLKHLQTKHNKLLIGSQQNEN